MDDQNLAKALACIEAASMEDLRDRRFLLSAIQQAGLHPDPRAIYGDDSIYMNPCHGLWQSPVELADLLLTLSGFQITSVLEIGTGDGWSIALMTAYLIRWNPTLRATTVDLDLDCQVSEAVTRMLPIRFVRGTSEQFRGCTFDFCFIDGGHDYNEVEEDYSCLGRFSLLCAFHDIDNPDVELECTRGGVPAFWRDLRLTEQEVSDFYEFIERPSGRAAMGTGLRIRRGTTK